MTDFQRSAARLFVEQASSRLARVTGVGQRVVQRWLSGSRVVPDDVRAWVSRQESVLEGTGLPERLRETVRAAAAAGVHAEVIAAHLAALHREATGREVD